MSVEVLDNFLLPKGRARLKEDLAESPYEVVRASWAEQTRSAVRTLLTATINRAIKAGEMWKESDDQHLSSLSFQVASLAIRAKEGNQEQRGEMEQAIKWFWSKSARHKEPDEKTCTRCKEGP